MLHCSSMIVALILMVIKSGKSSRQAGIKSNLTGQDFLPKPFKVRISDNF